MKKIIFIFLCTWNFLFADLTEDLIVAITENNYIKVTTLLKKGAKVNPNPTGDFIDKRPIFYAVATHDVENLSENEMKNYIDTKIKIIDLLISKGASVNETYDDGSRYSESERLFDSITNPRIAEYIAKKGVKFNSLLEEAVAQKDLLKVQSLLNKKTLEKSKNDAFIMAVNFDYKEIVDYFLKDKSIDKEEGLSVAVGNNQYDMIELFLLAGVDVNKYQPIDIALRNDNRIIFDLLIKHGAKY